MLYNKFPEITIKGYDDESFQGYSQIVQKIKTKSSENSVICIECYPGVRYDELKKGIIDELETSMVVLADDCAKDIAKINQMMERNLTDDRVFGVLSCHKLIEFFDEQKIAKVKKEIETTKGIRVVYGVGASLIAKYDVLIYADLARWEIQQRYRSQEIGNWLIDNHDEDILKKYKRGFFVEWRVADRIKKGLYNEMDFYLDTNEKDAPKMVTGAAFMAAMDEAVKGPFRLVPYFDPGVWGGEWMKENCSMPDIESNLAWAFDGVPEENSLFLRFGDVRIETPAINLVFNKPSELLGKRVHARFGTEFPIRFDFLDTMDGQNLSLQVHPLVEYIQENFGMHYTQDESYYLLDAKEDAVVYLGVKEGVNTKKMIEDLKVAERGEAIFDAEKYVNMLPAKKHDHFLIPAGTIHCSGANTMVLEISATPYIFTFKLWDWSRTGLDGLPRPVHIDHGAKNIDWKRNTEWVKENLVNNISVIKEEDGIKEESTGLHELEFIETRRHWFDRKVTHSTENSVNVLNLVEGEQAIVESVDGGFEPFIVNYAETFIIPETIKEYSIRPYGASEGKTVATVKAFVRG